MGSPFVAAPMPTSEGVGPWTAAGPLGLNAEGWLNPDQSAVCWGSPHADDRPKGAEVSLLVLHCISLPRGHYGGTAVRDLFLGQLDCSADPSFTELEGLKVSSHFFIDRAGIIHQFVSVYRRAWHAGASAFMGQSGCNDFSVGIELEGVDDAAFTDAQQSQCLRLSLALAQALPGLIWMAGHSDIAPGRKTDPGTGWDWERFQLEVDSGLSVARPDRGLKYFFNTKS